MCIRDSVCVAHGARCAPPRERARSSRVTRRPRGGCELRGPRPEQLVVVVGTGTDVGKTYVSAALLLASHALGMTVAARKPVQSFDPEDEVTDADVLATASGEEPTVVCPAHRWYEVPYAPPMAADSLNRPIMFHEDLLEELVWPFPRVSLGVVEMAGGVASPIAFDDADPVEFIRALDPDRVILVADAGLGTVNATRLSYRAVSYTHLDVYKRQSEHRVSDTDPVHEAIVSRRGTPVGWTPADPWVKLQRRREQ